MGVSKSLDFFLENISLLQIQKGLCWHFWIRYCVCIRSMRVIVDLVFLDMAKVFDKVPNNRFLDKLMKQSICGKVLKILSSWLCSHKYRGLYFR